MTPELQPDVLLIKSVDLTFEQLGYGNSQLSEQEFQWISLYLPRNLVPHSEGSYLDLITSHVPDVPEKPSVLRVEMNSIPLSVIPLSEENADLTTYRLYFKNTPLTPGRNTVRISLDTGGGCNIRGARVDVAVYDTSSFHIEYALTQHQPDLAFYPVPFFERSFEYEPVYIVLPDNPSETELSAAATVAAGLGKLSNAQIRLASTLDTQISSDIRNSYHLIVIGKKGANRLIDQLDLPLRLDDQVLSEEQGVIQELVSPWNPLRMILVISSQSDEGLVKASQALNREAQLLGMQGPVAIVEMVLPPESVGSRQRDDDFTLADLGYEEEVVYGTRPHTLDYGFHMPLGWTAVEEPRFTLYFGHTKTVDPTHSSLIVYLNDVPIDSVLLNDSNASDGTLEVQLPPRLINSGANRVRISIEMNLGDEDKCLFLDAGQLWTTIYRHSYFHMPFVLQDVEPSLALFPYPFNKEADLGGPLLILPDRPQQTDYDLMLQVATGLGTADRGGFLTLSVTTSDLVTEEHRRHKDLILIGRPSVNSLIAELNDWLPQPFELATDLMRPQFESVVFAQDPSRNIGLIEEVTAPWNPERMILVLTGTTDAGVALAATTLLSASDKLAGNVVVVEESIGIRSFDTRPQVSTPTDRVKAADSNHKLLIQLGERWW